jgi:hypothetical protein
VLRRRRSRRDDSNASGEEMYGQLRAMALEAVANGLVAPTADHPRVSGVVIDVPSDGGCATLVSLTDDTTSMYTSTGGGTIGAGAHASVASATHALLAAVEQHFDQFTDDDDPALPPRGIVRFHLLGPAGRRTADLPDEAFWGRADHPLMPVIAAAQELIAAIRTASPDEG